MSPNRRTAQIAEKIAILSVAIIVGLGLVTTFVTLNTRARVAVENALSGHVVALGCVQSCRSGATRRLQ